LSPFKPCFSAFAAGFRASPRPGHAPRNQLSAVVIAFFGVFHHINPAALLPTCDRNAQKPVDFEHRATLKTMNRIVLVDPGRWHTVIGLPTPDEVIGHE
jgi:hypothetical protein